MAAYEVRSREATVRRWSGERGYPEYVDIVVHEVFPAGGTEPVASTEDKHAADELAVLLNRIPDGRIGPILEAIGDVAVHNYLKGRSEHYEPRPHQPQYPFERHSIA